MDAKIDILQNTKRKLCGMLIYCLMNFLFSKVLFTQRLQTLS